MDRGLSIAASGMLAEQVRQDQIANDLANASTPGYKADRAAQRSFGQVLVTTGDGIPVGTATGGVRIDAVATDLSQGALRQTDEPLDVALEGPGFLAVQTAAGVRYTRDGQLSLDGSGRLVTQQGRPVLDPAGRPIALPRADGLEIAADGTLTLDGKPAGKLGVVSVTSPVKDGDGLFAGTPAGTPAGTAVRQGSLEQSSVDAARVMVDMIVSLRAFEASQRVIRAIDDTLGRGINGAGSVNPT
jgi:flagellar basal-body rod protein FlgF